MSHIAKITPPWPKAECINEQWEMAIIYSNRGNVKWKSLLYSPWFIPLNDMICRQCVHPKSQKAFSSNEKNDWTVYGTVLPAYTVFKYILCSITICVKYLIIQNCSLNIIPLSPELLLLHPVELCPFPCHIPQIWLSRALWVLLHLRHRQLLQEEDLMTQ